MVTLELYAGWNFFSYSALSTDFLAESFMGCFGERWISYSKVEEGNLHKGKALNGELNLEVSAASIFLPSNVSDSCLCFGSNGSKDMFLVASKGAGVVLSDNPKLRGLSCALFKSSLIFTSLMSTVARR